MTRVTKGPVYLADIAGGNHPVKSAVRAATTGDITLSGLQTIDGVNLAQDDRVLVRNQVVASQNGIYDVDAGAWPRAFDMIRWIRQVAAAFIPVKEGTTNVGKTFQCISPDGGTIDVTDMEFVEVGGVIVGSGGLLKSVQVFTTSGTWIKPAGITSIRVQIAAGGAGGSSVSNPSTGAGGGGAGGYSEGIFDVIGTSSEIATVGSPGTGGPGGTGTLGGAGGTTSLGTLLMATGGSPGGGVNFGGPGGVGSGGDINIDGGGGSGRSGSVGGTGGASYFGGGTTGSNNANADDSMVPGAGGGGGGEVIGIFGDGGDGGVGIIIIWEYE